MQQKNLIIMSNRNLNAQTYEMVLSGDGLNMNAGQFVELSVDGCFLRRPISVCACTNDTLTLVYKVVGQGTKKMSQELVGKSIDTLTDLGNGFEYFNAKKPMLIGGGIGCAPLYQLAKNFAKKGIVPTIILGFKNADEVFYEKEFSELGKFIITTDDGSVGQKGNAVKAMKAYCRLHEDVFDKYFACGPTNMLKNLQAFSNKGEISMEAHMGCGFGACMGCSIVTTKGYKRVCKEGPVFNADELIFD